MQMSPYHSIVFMPHPQQGRNSRGGGGAVISMIDGELPLPPPPHLTHEMGSWLWKLIENLLFYSQLLNRDIVLQRWYILLFSHIKDTNYLEYITPN